MIKTSIQYIFCYHLILVVKYRRKVFDDRISERAREIFLYIAPKYDITMVSRPDTGFPKFRSKHHSRACYTTNVVNGNIRITADSRLKLPKLTPVRMILHRDVPDISNAAAGSGRNFLSATGYTNANAGTGETEM